MPAQDLERVLKAALGQQPQQGRALGRPQAAQALLAGQPLTSPFGTIGPLPRIKTSAIGSTIKNFPMLKL